MDLRAAVVVIGGGIVGCATAYYLAQRGIAVTLVEKGEIADEQSSRAGGFVRQQSLDIGHMDDARFAVGRVAKPKSVM